MLRSPGLRSGLAGSLLKACQHSVKRYIVPGKRVKAFDEISFSFSHSSRMK
jgi:hypothetical protein